MNKRLYQIRLDQLQKHRYSTGLDKTNFTLKDILVQAQSLFT